MSTINTAFGKRHVVRRIGTHGVYWQTLPTESAPDGEWWVLNEQHGFVPVASNSRGLLAALDEIASEWRCYARPARLNGKPCGHMNAGKPATFRGLLVCAECGCTKIASDSRRERLQPALATP